MNIPSAVGTPVVNRPYNIWRFVKRLCYAIFCVVTPGFTVAKLAFNLGLIYGKLTPACFDIKMFNPLQ